MNFASAPNTSDKLRSLIQEADPRVLVIEFSGVPNLEYTALTRLAALDEELDAEGITLWLVALNPEVLRVIRRAPLGERIGEERLFFNLHLAVEAYLKNFT